MPTPLETIELVAEGFDTGLVGSIGLAIFAFDGSVQVARSTAGIAELDSLGIYRKTITTPATPGTYFVVWDEGGVSAEETLVVDPAPLVSPPPAPAVGGPCTPWIEAADLACEITDSGQLQEAIDAATWLLYIASGQRYRGSCRVSVRPCRAGWETCWEQVLTPTTWIGGTSSGRWDSCGCQGLSVVRLAGLSVRAIESVTIDGDTLDAARYRLDRNGVLVRTDGAVWPACQNMAVQPGDPGSFVITYVWGQDAPQAAKNAASQLACELWSAQHNPDVCRLPANVTELVRQGVTIRRAVQAFNLRNGATGLPAVDAFLGSVSRSRPAVVYSPDVAPFPRPT